MKPANNNTEGPCVPPAVHEMRAGLADMRKALGMKEPEAFMIEPVERYSAEKIQRMTRGDDE